jgi:hypothetical protein
MRHSVTVICLTILSSFATAQIPAALQKNFTIQRQLDKEYFVYEKNGKTGVVNKSGTVILPAVYGGIYYTRFNLFVVRKEEKQGVVNAQNKVLLPFDFESIFIVSPQRMHVRKEDNNFILSSSNRFIADTSEAPAFIFQQAEDVFTPPMIVPDEVYASAQDNVFRKEDGVYLVNGNDTIKTNYQDIQPLEMEGRYVKFKMNDRWGILDEKGKEKVPAAYDNISEDYNLHHVIVTFGLHKTLLDHQFKPIEIGPFEEIEYANSDGFAIVQIDSKVGLIDSSGKMVIQPMKGLIRQFGDHHHEIRIDTAWKTDIIDKNLKSILPPGTSAIGWSDNIILLKTKDNKMGAMHAAGYQLLRPIYEEVFFGNTDNDPNYLFQVRKGDKWGLLDFQEKQIAPYVYDKIYLFHDGIATAVLKKKGGVISDKNEVVLPFIYDETSYTYNDVDLLRVIKDSKYGFVDKKGKIIVPVEYEHADEDFYIGLSRAKKNGKWGYIDKSGKVIIPFEYDETTVFYSDKTKVKKANTWYEIDKTGKVLGETSSPY